MNEFEKVFLSNNTKGVNLNSIGHRCKDLNKVNLHNYILFVGDNVCLSYHTPIEQTFPYLISQELKIDYYNLAVFNGGMDGVRVNLFSWLFKIKQPPKAIIMACEFANAVMISGPTLDWISNADYKNEDVQKLLSTGNVVGFHNGRRRLLSSLINQLNYPIYQITFNDKENLVDATNVINLSFNGDIFNQQGIADLVVNTMKEKSSSIRP